MNFSPFTKHYGEIYVMFIGKLLSNTHGAFVKLPENLGKAHEVFRRGRGGELF